ncbi:hypothetical protein Despr_2074 [Desulfobulbus propionicus DSM 2032]|jgi:hypothetical protein|uniref:Type 4 fimbrial biogenesis protein PilX N-terminal domain-containing protein n=1 Tax=Desulfobulbus propionicus (strain ATCC 33891 / DSM 2032 / VKM B-1956 / 1pr3) TaxID=577650 RepID=A0A7U4DPQ4_DESPD|nr:hypothetical protein [Desulfobulbus propionicus]ADW18222.1 hypothetical protein Despr_2074 [Desulfobulbus propionicus DSM 2032]
MPSKTYSTWQGKPPLDNEHGFVMVMALMMLVVLSIMGGASMMIRNTEQQIVRNTEIIHTNFYAVEAVTVEGATAIENLSDTDLLEDPLKSLSLATHKWLRPNDPDGGSVIDLEISANWPDPLITPQATSFTVGDRDIVPNGYDSDGTKDKDRIWYAAVQGNLNSDNNSYDICAGSDVSNSEKVEKCYTVYGMYDVKSGTGKAYAGRRLLMVGYKKTVYLP